MKYPQLVSTRAVNAISDWLVSRLEQLGVESAQIYTRLLLSLLQSSVQVNDPIEFSNLEIYFANRKGGGGTGTAGGHSKRYHHYLPSDTETLKKLNAVQCLREIVSAEYETISLEQLVDELCVKLNDIEKQSQDIYYNGQESFPSTTLTTITTFLDESITSTTTNSQSKQQPQQQQHNNNNNNNFHNNRNNNTTAQKLGKNVNDTNLVNDQDNDPKKRYFRAFPALSKEMEESFLLWRRNTKTLTWPIVGHIVNDNNTSNNLRKSSETDTDSVVNNKSEEIEKFEKNKEVTVNFNTTTTNAITTTSTTTNTNQDVAVTTATLKRKTRRHRHNHLSQNKGKTTTTHLRRNTFANGSHHTPLTITGRARVGGEKKKHSSHQRHSSESTNIWDTDFKGCWEMGPDLIEEFLLRQNATKRQQHQRTASECDAGSIDNNYNNTSIDTEIEEIQQSQTPSQAIERDCNSSAMSLPNVDISFFSDDNGNDDDECAVVAPDNLYENNYKSNSLNLPSDFDNTPPKRLYERECPSRNLLKGIIFNSDTTNGLLTADQQREFALLEAKFKSQKVQALWQDNEIIDNKLKTKTFNEDIMMAAEHESGSGYGPKNISSAFYATTSLNALAPFKHDLWNFWSNYEHFNKLSSATSFSSMVTTRIGDSGASSGTTGIDSGDYFSMPTHFDNFDKSVGAMRRNGGDAGGGFGNHDSGRKPPVAAGAVDFNTNLSTPSGGLFLQNSIWSSSGDYMDGSGGVTLIADTDESFLFKVWQSNKKLNQMDAENIKSNNVEELTSLIYKEINKDDSNGGLKFQPYTNLKWSEGINAPPCSNIRNGDIINSTTTTTNNLCCIDNNCDLSKCKLRQAGDQGTCTGANWHIGGSGELVTRPDLQSWSVANPISLPEMYGRDVCDSIISANSGDDGNANNDDDDNNDEGDGLVTLPNHCNVTSSFVAYSRIKKYGTILPPPPPSLVLLMQSPFLEPIVNEPGSENTLVEEEGAVVEAAATTNCTSHGDSHFHPIEFYEDGHSFQINNTLDTVEYECDESGYLRYKSHQYLTYKRDGMILPDKASAADREGKDELARNQPIKLNVKFRVQRNCEIACQTDEQDFELIAQITKEAATTPLKQPPLFCDEAIIKAVSNAVKSGVFTSTSPSHEHSGSINNYRTWLPEATDEVDFSDSYFSQKTFDSVSRLCKEWSMKEMEKQCQLRCQPVGDLCYGGGSGGGGGGVINDDNDHDHDDNDDDDSNSNSCKGVRYDGSAATLSQPTTTHTLWGICAACNSCGGNGDDQSLPANRLLRDELRLEGDEIMSDLRFMQDLYIGNNDYDQETDVDTETDEEHHVARNPLQCRVRLNFDDLKTPPLSSYAYVCTDEATDETVTTQKTVLQKVNRLIEDLLKPSVEETNVQDSHMNPTNVNDEEKTKWSSRGWLGKEGENEANEKKSPKIATSNLWQFSNATECNIWRNDNNYAMKREYNNDSGENLKPMELLLRHMDNSCGPERQYLAKLKWEHENLSKIWQQCTPPPSPDHDHDHDHDIIMATVTASVDNAPPTTTNTTTEDSKDVQANDGMVERKNFINRQNSNSNLYDRYEQFLNTSTAKMKIAANRKRRHSASQNFSQQQQQLNDNSALVDINNGKMYNDGDECDDVLTVRPDILENIKTQESDKQAILTCKYWTTKTDNVTKAATGSLDTTAPAPAPAMMILASAHNSADPNGNALVVDVDDLGSSPNDDDDNDNINKALSCLIDTGTANINNNNATTTTTTNILKQVAMMSRPLTR